jgi:hypothetical protein
MTTVSQSACILPLLQHFKRLLFSLAQTAPFMTGSVSHASHFIRSVFQIVWSYRDCIVWFEALSRSFQFSSNFQNREGGYPPTRILLLLGARDSQNWELYHISLFSALPASNFAVISDRQLRLVIYSAWRSHQNIHEYSYFTFIWGVDISHFLKVLDVRFHLWLTTNTLSVLSIETHPVITLKAYLTSSKRWNCVDVIHWDMTPNLVVQWCTPRLASSQMQHIPQYKISYNSEMEDD